MLIVFVTTHSGFMPLTFRYQVSAFDFIDKACLRRILSSRLSRIWPYLYEKDSFQAEETFSLKIPSQFSGAFNEIYYFETSRVPHRLVLYTKKSGSILRTAF